MQRQFGALQQFSGERADSAKDSLPGMLAQLRQSLEALQSLVDAASAAGRAGSNGAAHGNGRSPRDARPSRAQRVRSLAERGGMLVRILRSEARCRWANRAWLEFTGRELGQLLGARWLDEVHPEDRARCADICRAPVASSQNYRVEYRLRRKAGGYAWIVEVGTPLLTARGALGGYLGTAIEITEHKQAQTHLAVQYAVAHVLSAASSLEEAGAALLRILCEKLDWELGELWSMEPEGRVLRCVQCWAAPSVDLTELHAAAGARPFPSGAGSPWQSGSPVWIADIGSDAALAREPEAQRLGMHAMFRLPLLVQGETRAVLRVFSRAVREADPAAVEFMNSVGAQIGQFLQRQLGAAQMRESEARKAAILEGSLDAVLTIDARRRVVEFNAAAETIFGYRRRDVLGRDLAALIVPPRLREQALAAWEHYAAMGDDRLLGQRFGTLAMRSDGTEFPVDFALAPIDVGSQPLLTIYVSDMSARRAAEKAVHRYQERLRSLMADLLLAEERERRRLAVDLHDGLSQTIALAQMKLCSLRAGLNGKHAQRIDEIEGLIEQANHSARAISFELSPPVLHDLGLEPAVEWLVENIRARYGLEIQLKDDGQAKPTDEKTRVILFRAIRELLINAAKHARARRVEVRLQREQDRLRAAVEDDGVGMDTEASSGDGFGLFSIHERLSHVGGSMRIESAPGRGTKVHLSAPLAGERSRKTRQEA